MLSRISSQAGCCRSHPSTASRCLLVRLPLLGQVQDLAQGRQIALQRFAAVSDDEEQRCVFAGTPPGVFQREPRLAYAAHAIQQPRDNRRGAALGNGPEALGEFAERGLAAFEELANAQ